MKAHQTKPKQQPQHPRFTLLQVATLAAALAALPASAATTWTITSTGDDNIPGTLRYAVNSALDGDTIDLATLSGTIVLNSYLSVESDVNIVGPGPDQLAVDGGGTVGPLFWIIPGTTAGISGLTMSHGHFEFGGAIYNDQANLTLNNCALLDNVASVGGAIMNDASDLYGVHGASSAGHASLTIMDCTFSGNSAETIGGAIANMGEWGSATLSISQSTLSGNVASDGGGGVANVGDGYFAFNVGATANLTVSTSTLIGNSARTGGGILNMANSGLATTALINSTLSANSAASEEGDGDGGAVINVYAPYSAANALLTLDNCTFSSNSADGRGGGVFNFGGRVGTRNTLFSAGSEGQNLFDDEVGGSITSYGSNLSNDNGGGFLNQAGDQVNLDPMLGPLQDNGGPTWTHALLTGSPAIDAGASTDIAGNPVTADQRGFARPAGSGNDIGAFEVSDPGVAFASFDASKLRIWLGPPASFQLQSSFTLGASSDGINPLTEPVTLQIGTLTLILPAGSFQLNKPGDAVFSRVVDGISFNLKFRHAGGGNWVFKANATNPNLAETANPVTVRLSIANDTGVWTGNVPIH